MTNIVPVVSIDEIIDKSIIAGVYLNKRPSMDEKVFYEATVVCKTIDDPFARNGLTKVFCNKNDAIKWLIHRHNIKNWNDWTEKPDGPKTIGTTVALPLVPPMQSIQVNGTTRPVKII